MLKPCARPPKQPMVWEGLANGFKTMYEVDVLNTNILSFIQYLRTILT